MTNSTHFLMSTNKSLYRFYTHPITGRHKAYICVEGCAEELITKDINNSRKLYQSLRKEGALVVTRTEYIKYCNSNK